MYSDFNMHNYYGFDNFNYRGYYDFRNDKQANINNSEIITLNQAIDLIIQSVAGERED